MKKTYAPLAIPLLINTLSSCGGGSSPNNSSSSSGVTASETTASITADTPSSSELQSGTELEINPNITLNSDLSFNYDNSENGIFPVVTTNTTNAGSYIVSEIGDSLQILFTFHTAVDDISVFTITLSNFYDFQNDGIIDAFDYVAEVGNSTESDTGYVTSTNLATAVKADSEFDALTGAPTASEFYDLYINGTLIFVEQHDNYDGIDYDSYIKFTSNNTWVEHEGTQYEASGTYTYTKTSTNTATLVLLTDDYGGEYTVSDSVHSYEYTNIINTITLTFSSKIAANYTSNYTLDYQNFTDGVLTENGTISDTDEGGFYVIPQ